MSLENETHITKFANSESRSFRLFLRQELLRRCSGNPHYSLRAFARLLQIEPSALSKILNGKRSLSPSMLKKLSTRLSLSPHQYQKFASQVVENRGNKKVDVAPTDYREILLDHFHIISDWYHFAILELTTIGGFKAQPKWVAKTLGITVSEVNAAIERLTRLEFLEITSNGKWIDRSGEITTIRNDFTDAAQIKLQKQILSHALKALEETSIQHRDNTAMTMAIDSSLLPEAKTRIKNFRRELCDFLQKGQARDSVYELGIALFPVTKLQKPIQENKS